MKKVLSKDGFIIYYKDIPATIRFNQVEASNLFGSNIDFKTLDNFCEIVHLEISDRCNLDCPYCYVKKEGKEISIGDWKFIIRQLARYGVFQITFGGGEPLMKEGWQELLRHAVERGLNVGMTTHGLLLEKADPKDLRLFKQINVSLHNNPRKLMDSLNLLRMLGIKRGINYTVRKDTKIYMGLMKMFCLDYDAELLMLAYKPVIKDYENCVPKDIILEYAKELTAAGVRVAVDGLCVDRCMQKISFCDIDSQGNVLPCSFIREPIGNVLDEDFSVIWKRRGKQIPCPYMENRHE